MGDAAPVQLSPMTALQLGSVPGYVGHGCSIATGNPTRNLGVAYILGNWEMLSSDDEDIANEFPTLCTSCALCNHALYGGRYHTSDTSVCVDLSIIGGVPGTTDEYGDDIACTHGFHTVLAAIAVHVDIEDVPHVAIVIIVTAPPTEDALMRVPLTHFTKTTQRTEIILWKRSWAPFLHGCRQSHQPHPSTAHTWIKR